MYLKYLAILAFFLIPFSASAAYVVPQGGTGQSTLPASQLLTGNGTAAIYGTATTTASCSGSTSCSSFTIIGSSPITISSTVSSSLSTTSPWITGQVAYVVDNGHVSSVATTSVSNGTGISFTGTAGALLGGSSLTITNSSPLSGLSASYPFSFSNPTLTWIGLATSTELVSGYIPFATGVNTIGVDSAFIWDNTNKRLGIGSTTPGSLLSVGNSGWNFYDNATSTKSGTGGINIAGGCYAIEGTCLSTGGSGTVTSIATNNGITGGTITTSGTIGLAAIAANSVLGNISGSSAVPTALATSSLFQNASASNTGLLTSTDWSTFNGKQPALSLLAGTYVNGDMCTYASSGTLLNCNTAVPAGTVTSITSPNSTLTVGGTSAIPTLDLNLAHANIWTALQSFSNATSTQFTAGSSNQFYINSSGTIALQEQRAATSTAYSLNWSTSGPQLLYQTGTSATTIYLTAATTSQYVGSRKLVVVCNGSGAAGAITWVGAEWAGGTTPTQTTTANQCDAWSFFVTAATSTVGSPSYKVFGAASTGFQ